MSMTLTEIEARVLGALIEKEITTPEYYPLSLNALVNACNQKNNREPVMNLGEDEVAAAVQGLRDKQLAEPISYSGSRVVKYSHTLGEAFNLDRRETAILCVLFLRGPQTVGELRTRTERMVRFSDLHEVQAELDALAARDDPLVRRLARGPGQKEDRYGQLLGGSTGETRSAPAAVASQAGPGNALSPAMTTGRTAATGDEVAALRAELAELRLEVGAVRSALDDLREQLGA